MTAKVRKKAIYIAAILIFVFNFVSVCGNRTEEVDFAKNGTHTLNVQSTIPINNTLKDGNERETNVTEEKIYNAITENLNNPFLYNSSSDVQPLNFPHNLQIIGEILKELKNEACVRDTTLVLEGMTRHERWALELFDSFPKFPVGILYGNYYQLGNFDECVGVKHSFNEDALVTTVQGQYCLADIHFSYQETNTGRFARSTSRHNIKKNRNKYNTTVIHWGICLPASCTTNDAEIFVQKIFSSAVENFKVVSTDINPSKCYYEKSEPLSTLEIIYGCVIGAFLIFIILATAFHYKFLRQRKTCVAYNVDTLRTQNSSLLKELLKCFSIIHTTQKFLHIKPNELNLECICGIKFLSMNLIIVGHSLIFMFGGPVVNRNFFEETSVKLENSPFLNNPLLVDTFLLVGGFLMCYLLLIEFEKRKGKVNFLILYIARFIRLTPSYIVVIGLYTTYLYRLGSGPLWQSKIGLEKERCLNSWWTNILYINNYVNTDNLCMFQSWYLAVDYHMFIIAPFVVYPLWRWRRIGESLLGILTFISVAIPFWITYRDDLDPTLMAYPPEISDLSTNFYFVNVYMKTHMRANSYCIGLFFGYLVYKLQSTGTKIPAYIIWLCWTLAASLGVMSMYSVVIFYNPEHTESSFESAAYASLHRVAWCLGIGWVLLVCITDNAPIINKFLSNKFFVPASRLTYCAYLTNGLIEVYNIGVLRQSVFMSKYELACKILGHLLLTYTLAFLLCIFFESPIHGLEKILLRRKKMKEEKHKSSLKSVDES